jgi:hypothetical protein
MINKEVKLNETEVRLAKFIGKNRYEGSRKAGVHNAKIGGQSNEQTDQEGAGAELAFCKLFNCYPDLAMQLKSAKKGTDKGDATLEGKVVDVKSTTYKTGRLLAAKWKDPNSNVYAYALLTGEMPNYTFRGFMKSENLLRDEMLRDLGRGEGYVAEQEDLVEWEELEK